MSTSLSTSLRRRDVLKIAALAATGIAVSPFAQLLGAEAADQSRKKVLFFTKSSGFQHSVITRPAEDPTKLAYAEQILTDLGAQHGFDVTCSKDGTIFGSPDTYRTYDVFAFYTTGDLTTESDKYATHKGPDGKQVEDKSKLLWKEPAMPAGAKEKFLDAIRSGKGFLGFHCASDTFHSPGFTHKTDFLRDVDENGKDKFDPYIQMVGGEFIIHGKQQKATLKTIDPTFPGASAFDNQAIHEEWYSLKNFQPDLHVILAQDCTGMDGPMYQRPPYPQTWARMHGDGRVFFTSMGHREDIWKRPDFVDLVVAALNWTSRRADADVAPNISTATPEANPKSNPATGPAANAK